MDFDFGDEAPSKPTQRTSKFLPKGAKPIPKPEPQSQPVVPTKQEHTDIQAQLPSIDDGIETKPDETMAEEGEKLKEEDPMDMDEDINQEEEEDYVVREIDVFFTPPPLDTNAELYVMQYPLRPSWRPYELDTRCKQVRVKPKAGKVEVDLLLDTNHNYDSDVPDKLRIKKQILSSWKPPLKTSYAVGVLVGNKLHLNPVHAVVQLRPSMEHLMSGGLKKKSATENVERTVDSNEVTAVKATSSTKKHGKVVTPSTAQATDAEEPWISLDYHGMDSSLTTRYHQKMTSHDSSRIEFSMSGYDYMNSLCPVSSTENNEDRSLSIRFLLSLPLDARFNKWFSEVPQLNRFDALKRLAPDGSSADFWKVLQSVAYLVQGLWVSKSSVVAKLKDSQKLAREYVLYLFTKGTVIKRTDLEEYQLYKEAEVFLKEFAVFKPSTKEWKFKEPPDVSFMKSHEDIVKQQENRWERVGKKCEEDLKKRLSRPVLKNSSRPVMKSVPSTSGKADQVPKVNVNGATASERVAISEETREALPKALETLFRKHNVCSLQQICQGLTEQGILKTDTAPLSELSSVIDQVAVKIRDVYVLKSLGDPSLDPLRRVVIDLFCAKEPYAKLKKADVVEAGKIQLGRDIDNKEYTQVMNQLCVSVKGNAWILKSGDGNLKLNNLEVPNAPKF